MTTHKKTMPPLGKYEKNVVKTARLLDNNTSVNFYRKIKS